MGGLTVIQVARLSGVSADAVRYYSRKGLLKPSRSAANGYRQYGAADVQRLRFIKRAQALGFTLGEIASIVDHAAEGKSPCPIARDIVQRRIELTTQQLTDLSRLQARMQGALTKWSSMQDGVPDGDAICRLIESVDFDGAADGNMVAAVNRSATLRLRSVRVASPKRHLGSKEGVTGAAGGRRLKAQRRNR